MRRDAARLADGPFDVLVIGGGIYGAWTAYDAALRGFKVALIDKGDWASATSSASSKLIHGGLRYLEQLHFGLVRKSLDERKRLYELAPHRVHPLNFVVPIYRGSRVGKTRMRLGLWLYDRLAGRGQPVAPHQWHDAEAVVSRHPHIAPDGLRGALTYGDCGTDDALFALEIVDGACDAGAVTVNYMRATKLLVENGRNGRVVGAQLRDEISGDTLDVRASTVVEATGPWGSSLAVDTGPRVRTIKGVHLVFPGLTTTHAMLVMSRRDNRVIFILPWYGRTLVGTTDSDYRGDLDHIDVNHEEVDYLLGEANTALREPLARSAIVGRFAGVRALQFAEGRSPSSVSREWGVASPRKGLMVSVGGKYTSARADASGIVDRIAQFLNRAPGTSPTASRPFPWRPPQPLAEWQVATEKRLGSFDVDADATACIMDRYGTRVDVLIEILSRRRELATRIDPDLPFVGAEVALAATHGMAQTLDDAMRRRLPMTILSRPNRSVAERVADIAGPLLGWSDERREREIVAVMKQWAWEPATSEP